MFMPGKRSSVEVLLKEEQELWESDPQERSRVQVPG